MQEIRAFQIDASTHLLSTIRSAERWSPLPSLPYLLGPCVGRSLAAAHSDPLTLSSLAVPPTIPDPLTPCTHRDSSQRNSKYLAAEVACATTPPCAPCPYEQLQLLYKSTRVQLLSSVSSSKSFTSLNKQSQSWSKSEIPSQALSSLREHQTRKSTLQLSLALVLVSSLEFQLLSVSLSITEPQ